MATLNGTAVVFAFDLAAGITITNLNGVLLQSKDHAKEAERDITRDATGSRVQSTHYDFRDTAVLRYKVSGTGIANAIVNTALQTLGTLLAVTACGSDPAMIAANWEVVGSKLTQTNTSAAEIELTIEKAAGITAVTSA